jgi:GT2 family glycosyltransferase
MYKRNALASEPTISVVICAYSNDRRSELLASIASVQEQKYKPLEIIVVVDHNPSLEAFVRDSTDNVKLLPNSKKKGLSGARNTGIEMARGNIIAFLDDDAVATETWLFEMAKTFRDASVIGMGGKVIPVWPRCAPKWLPEEFLWVVGCSFRGQPLGVVEIRNPIGCNMAFRSEAFSLAGTFETGRGRLGDDAAGDEETEFSVRLKRTAPRSIILQNPLALVYHHIAGSRLSWSYFRSRCVAEGRSKALLVAVTGPHDGLSSERTYITHTLPWGFLKGLGETIGRRDFWGLARATNIALGLCFTVYGYLGGRWQLRTKSVKSIFQPFKICEVETTEPLPTIDMQESSGKVEYGGVFCLLRNRGRPIGCIEWRTAESRISPSQLHTLINEQVETEQQDPYSASDTPAIRPAITIVIATKDRTESLSRCLDSLLNQDYPSLDILVVDNAPATEETATMIREKYSSVGCVRYIRENIPGLGRAHNKGLALTEAPVVAFTDDDVRVDAGWLTAIATAFNSDRNVACVTGLILPAELQTRAQFWTEKHGGFGKGFTRKIFDLETNHATGPLYPYTAGQFGSGANMAFRSDILRALGGFDPALGAGTIARGGDDLACFFAVIRAGFKIVYEPAAIVWHYHRQEEAGMRRQALGYGIGLGAYLTKLVIDDPRIILNYIRLLPAGLTYIIGNRSDKNRRLPSDYPRGLRWRERFGIVIGVAAYFASRFRAARKNHTAKLLRSS